jgi:hypothetical protein
MDEQRAVLARVVPLLRQLPVATNLRDLYVTLCVEDAARELLHQAQAAGADPVSLSLARQWLSIPSKDRVKNIDGLLNRLFVFVSGPYADRLNAYQPDIDIGQVVTSGQSLYLHLPLTNFAKDVAIALVETFGVEARKRQLGGTEGLPSFPLIFDDWGAFFHPGFGPFSARCRSAQMPLNFGFQSCPTRCHRACLPTTMTPLPQSHHARRAMRLANMPCGCSAYTHVNVNSPAKARRYLPGTHKRRASSRASCASCSRARSISRPCNNATTVL